MNKPDLHALVSSIGAIREQLSALDDKIEEARQAALGIDGPTGEIVSGDAYETFPPMREKVGDARLALNEVERMAAEAQGYRDFAASGAVVI